MTRPDADERIARALERIARALEVATGTAPRRGRREVQRPPVELSELDRARVSAVARRHGIR